MATLKVTLGIVAISCAVVALGRPQLAGQVIEQNLARLKSTAETERARGEAEILRAGPDALPLLVKELQSGDRVYQLRAERLFLSLLDGLLSMLDNEYAALTLDQGELAGLEEHQRFVKERKELQEKLEAWKARDPRAIEKRDALLILERLEVREKLALAQQGPQLGEEASKELARLRADRESWRQENPNFDEELRPFLRLARLEGLGTTGDDLSELEEIRLGELKERVADRAPRLESLQARLVEFGSPAYNALLARATVVRERHVAHYRQLVTQHIEAAGETLIPPVAALDELQGVRYHRSLLWVFVAAMDGPRREAAEAALGKHVEWTLADLQDAEPLSRERAKEELYLLGERGRKALQGAVADREPFLRNLLKWRIRPQTYARTGIDFHDFPAADFREKRRRLFEYAIVAEKEALPTLRAIITDDELGQSFQVKLAAAKAMAGQHDMSGYNFLIIKHPDLTLKKPEVSREILIIQGNEHLRDKNYERAVEDLQKVLDERPFDFQANYYIAFSYLLMKRYAKAIHHFEIARRINPEDELTLYNLACAYALHGGKSQEAIDALEASVKAGFSDPEHMEKDPDLDSLRGEERYQQLVERMKSGEK